MSEKASARLVIALGLASFAFLIGFGALDRILAGGCAQTFSMFQFQLGGFEGAQAVLTGPCGYERAGAAHWINRLDVFAFIPVYTAFLVLAARVLSGRWFGPVTLIAILAALAAALADWRETFAQLGVTEWVLAHRGADFEAMREPVGVVLQSAQWKYAALSANSAALALIAFLKKPPLRFIGALALLPIMGASAVVDDPVRAPLVAITFGLGWGALIFYAARIVRAKPENDAL